MCTYILGVGYISIAVSWNRQEVLQNLIHLFQSLLYLEVNLHAFGVEGTILIVLNIAAAAPRNRSRGS